MSSVSSTSSGSSTLSSILASGSLPSVGNTATNTSEAPNLAVSGLASGMNWQTTVEELGQAEAAPETQWEAQQTAYNTQNAALSTIKTDLTTLQTDAQALQDPTLYQSTTASSSAPAVATVTTASGATPGTYDFNIATLATEAQLNGQANISQGLVPDGNPADVTIGTAGFATPITPGTFTVDGAQVTIAATDTLQDVFNNIASATNNAVTASYDSGTDEITLTSSNSNPVVLGSAGDTSNFLQVAQLYGTTTPSVTSTSALGRVNTTVDMANSDLATAVTDGGSGNGAFTINGVTINYDASTDSIQDVLNSINSSAAGVTASYDAVNNRFILSNNTTGNVGISAQDVTGNFLAATGLSNGTLASGTNLTYTLNNGTQTLVSESNTITQNSSGIAGLSVTALTTGSTTVSVNTDTSAITTAIQQFITDYNTVQNYINSQQTVTTSASGTVTPGTLTGDQTVNDIASQLRTLSFTAGTGLSSSAINTLGDLGITSDGQNNTLTLSDTSTLDSALANNLSAVQSFFAGSTDGVATQVNNFITSATAPDGELSNDQTTLSQESTDITTQINNLQSQISANEAQWTSEFQAMEQAESQSNQELTYLSEQVSNGTL